MDGHDGIIAMNSKPLLRPAGELAKTRVARPT